MVDRVEDWFYHVVVAQLSDSERFTDFSRIRVDVTALHRP